MKSLFLFFFLLKCIVALQKFLRVTGLACGEQNWIWFLALVRKGSKMCQDGFTNGLSPSNCPFLWQIWVLLKSLQTVSLKALNWKVSLPPPEPKTRDKVLGELRGPHLSPHWTQPWSSCLLLHGPLILGLGCADSEELDKSMYRNILGVSHRPCFRCA